MTSNQNELQQQPQPQSQLSPIPPYGEGRLLLREIKQNIKLFGPIFLGQVAMTAMSVVDTIMSGAAGTVHLAGVSMGASFYTPVMLFLVGMTVAIQPTLAQMRGANASPAAIVCKMQMMLTVCLIASLFLGALLALLPYCYSLIDGLDPQLVHIAKYYVLSLAVGMPGLALFNCMRGYWEGLGYSLPTTVFGLLALGMNIPLNYIFIFGKLGMPALGGIGCGVATSLTIYICAFIMVGYVLISPRFAQLRLFAQRTPILVAEVKAFLRFSLPLGLATTVEVACFSLVAFLLSPFGSQVVAGHSIAMNIAVVVSMLPLAIASALSIRLGVAHGAQDYLALRRAIVAAMILALCFYAVALVVLFFTHESIIGLYTNDQELIALAITLFFIYLVFILPDTTQTICVGVLRGLQDSKAIFVVTIISYWIIGMPLGVSAAYGYLTGTPLEAQGFWFSFIVALTGASAMYIGRIIYKVRTLRQSYAQAQAQAQAKVHV